LNCICVDGEAVVVADPVGFAPASPCVAINIVGGTAVAVTAVAVIGATVVSSGASVTCESDAAGADEAAESEAFVESLFGHPTSKTA
jgi:hypothetical protein